MKDFFIFNKKKIIIIATIVLILVLGISVLFFTLINNNKSNKIEEKAEIKKLFICKKSAKENEYDLADSIVLDNSESVQLFALKQVIENNEEKIEVIENQEIEWKSLNPDVVEIDRNGVLTKVSKGEALIMFTTKDEKENCYCYIYSNGIDIYIESSIFYGDVDGNGRLTENDAKLLDLYISGTIEFSEEQKIKADINPESQYSPCE